MEYRIGSFNVQNWSKGSSKDFEIIAKIIKQERLDVVAFQEILSEGAGLKRLLEQCVKYHLNNWEMCWGYPNEPADYEKQREIINNDRRREGYAYIWNKAKFKLAETNVLGKKRVFAPRIVNAVDGKDAPKLPRSFFARAPYYIRLHPCNGTFFELRLINIHIFHGNNSSLANISKRQEEFEKLVCEVLPAIDQRRFGNFRDTYTIAMGDYNLNILRSEHQSQDKNAYLQELMVASEYKGARIVTVQDDLTSLKNPDDTEIEGTESKDIGKNNYDHFSFRDNGFPKVSWNVIEAVDKYCDGDLSLYRKKVSDHLPIMIKIDLSAVPPFLETKILIDD